MNNTEKTIMVLGLLTFIGMAYWIVSSYPSNEEQIREIKLCEANGLGTYMVDSGHWRCEPLTNQSKE